MVKIIVNNVIVDTYGYEYIKNLEITGDLSYLDNGGQYLGIKFS